MVLGSLDMPDGCSVGWYKPQLVILTFKLLHFVGYNGRPEPGPEVPFDEFMEDGGAGDGPGLEESGAHARTEQEPIQVELEAKVPKAVVLRDIPEWRAKVPNLTVMATKEHLTALRMPEECDWARDGCALRSGASARNTGLLAVMTSTAPIDSEVSGARVLRLDVHRDLRAWGSRGCCKCREFR